MRVGIFQSLYGVMEIMKEFKDKTILITGAAGTLGKTLARLFAGQGCQLILVDMKSDLVSQVADDLRKQGVRAWAYALDIADSDAIRAFKRRVEEEVGRIDALVNNAGIVFGGVFESIPLEKHHLTMQVNIMGMMSLTHVFMSDLLQSRDGHLVNIASAAGLIGLPYGSSYSSSKWAVIGFSESIRLELAERGLKNLHVTTVSPSYLQNGKLRGIRAPFLVPFLNPNELGLQILDAMRHNEPMVRSPFLVKAINLMRVLPQHWVDTTARMLGVTSSMLRWKEN